MCREKDEWQFGIINEKGDEETKDCCLDSSESQEINKKRKQGEKERKDDMKWL